MEEEIQKLRGEILEKDEMLTALRKALKHNTSCAEELVNEARAMAQNTEESYRAQLEEKDKQVQILQSLIDSQKKKQVPSEFKPPERAFMDDFLLAVLEQKDKLADELHSLNNEYARMKAQLGMSEFQKEKLEAETRAIQRKTTEPEELPPTNSDSELKLAQDEAEELNHRLQESNKLVEQLRAQLSDQSRRSQRENERTRRKILFKSTHKGRGSGSLEVPSKSNTASKKEDQGDEEKKDSDEIQHLQEEIESLTNANDKLKEEMKQYTNVVNEEEMEELKRQFSEQVKMTVTAENKLERCEEELVMLRSLMSGTSKNGKVVEQIEKLSRDLDTALQEKTNAADQLKELSKELATTGAQVSRLRSEVREKATEIERLSNQLQSANMESEELKKMKAECGRLNQNIEDTEKERLRDKKEMETLKQKITDLETATAAGSQEYKNLEKSRNELAEMYAKEVIKRRKLHNTLVEIQGNVRVHCRVRPSLTNSSTAEDTAPALQVIDDWVVESIQQSPSRQFEFDRVYNPSSTSEDIFAEVCGMVSSFVDGYNVCIVAYGQTGSGKTHTMLGPSTDKGIEVMNGVIPQAMTEVFRLINEQTKVASFKVTASVLEVYNDYVRDLLSPKPWQKHEVYEASGVVSVPSAEQVEISNVEDLLGLVKRGMDSRVERQTDMNSHSSRSHLIVTVCCTRTPHHSGKKTASRIHLVDLAGSENAKLASTSDDGLQESKAINRSLAAFCDVMTALGHNSAGHIPYRNSKLTHMLKDSIGGDAKMLMIACVSPISKYFPSDTYCIIKHCFADVLQRRCKLCVLVRELEL
eukprot:m.108800 g.108800  ORF g.108800 m.108800 type:complete len:814 (+) comp13980_c0_seq2:409-2850(+)